MATMSVGTSGWNYPSGEAKWKGVFYPPKVDELEFYSRYFDTVEVNSTFYGPATEKASSNWVKKTPRNFKFALKLWQKFTHPKMFTETTGEKAVVGSDDYKLFREGLDPIVQAGKLGCLLIQFPPSFKAEEASLENLERYLVQFRDCPIAVELRHKSWSERAEELKSLFSSLDVSWAFIDEPKFSSSIEQSLEPTGSTFYMRFHGRNAAKWWRHKEAWERYDYLYSNQELLPFSEAIQHMLKEGKVRSIYVYFNNHARAEAVANALMLLSQLGLPIKAEIPSGMAERYPELKALASSSLDPQATNPPEKGQMPLL